MAQNGSPKFDSSKYLIFAIGSSLSAGFAACTNTFDPLTRAQGDQSEKSDIADGGEGRTAFPEN
jgi:hypothetical protein